MPRSIQEARWAYAPRPNSSENGTGVSPPDFIKARLERSGYSTEASSSSTGNPVAPVIRNTKLAGLAAVTGAPVDKNA